MANAWTVESTSGTDYAALDDSGNLVIAGALTAVGVTSTGANTTTRGVASGTALKVGGLAYSNTAASTAITGATETKTAFSTKYTLPANSLTAGTVIHVVAQGIHTATTGAETCDLSLEIGGVSITSNTGVDPANSEIFAYDVFIVCRTVGASGTIVAYGRKRIGATGTAEVPFILASSVIDTTIANDIAVYIDRQASATDADSARLDIMAVTVSG